MTKPLAGRPGRRIAVFGAGLLLSVAAWGNVLALDDPPVKTLSLVWEYATPRDTPQGIAADARERPVLYVAMKQGGLVVLDVAARQQPPRQLARLTMDQFQGLEVMHLTSAGERLYLALGNFFDARGSAAGLGVVDVADPRQPRVVGVWKSDQVSRGCASVLVDGGLAYLAAMPTGVIILDVSRPDRIQHVSTMQPDTQFPRRNPTRVQHPNARALALRDRLLFLAYDAGGLRVLDVANPREPREVSRYINPQFPHKQQAYNDVMLDGRLAYLTIDYAGLEIVDVSSPREPRQVGWWNPWRADTLANLWFNSPGHTNQIAFDARRQQVWLSAGDSELQVISVTNPAQPRLVARYGAIQDKLGTWGLTLAHGRAYLTYVATPVPFQGTWSGVKAVE